MGCPGSCWSTSERESDWNWLIAYLSRIIAELVLSLTLSAVTTTSLRDRVSSLRVMVREVFCPFKDSLSIPRNCISKSYSLLKGSENCPFSSLIAHFLESLSIILTPIRGTFCSSRITPVTLCCPNIKEELIKNNPNNRNFICS